MLNSILNWLEKNNHISWLIVIFIAIFIFYMSSLESSNLPSNNPHINSFFYHFIIFFIFGFFLILSVVKGKRINKNLIFIAITIAMIYGLTDEIHQFFVPGRCCAFEDILTNSIGILTSGIGYSVRVR